MFKEAAINKYSRTGNKTILYNGKWIEYVIEPISDKYRVITIHKRSDVIKKLKLMDADLYKKIVMIVMTNITNPAIIDANSRDTFIKNIIKFITNRIRTFIEQGMTADSPLWNFIKKDEVIEKPELYGILVGKERFHHSTFIELFGEVEDTGKSISQGKHNKWIFRWETKTKFDVEGLTKIIDEVEERLRSKGFDNLAYGELSITGSLGSKYADYLPESDYVRVSSKSINVGQGIHSFIHELGHRLWYKFLDIDKKREVDNKYRNLMKDKIDINKGDTVIEKSTGKEYEVEGVFGNSLSVKNDEGKIFITKIDNINKGFLEIKGKEKSDSDLYFSRDYSKKNTEEFFADSFMIYIMDEIKEPAKSWFEGIIK